ncbi:threonine-phosphate decarboxylase [Rhizobium sp. KVB221]|uniref:threonine-phosphate decarboxylase n=1 Tax=Rhizobium setariae TaxID=2801340 RepID=A0A937CMV9_9HYPH|nr:threonine-phosphate decarboxylase CobD [Rhizobium setariae]MBL0373146.1 threonine-phosphate decarboxylase [Rhizobium setariae]
MMAGIHHGGGLTAAVARYGGRAEDWLDLSTGINPNAVALPDIPISIWNRLPDRELIDDARRAAADWYLAGSSTAAGPAGSIAHPLPVPGTQAFIQILPKLVPQDRPVAILSPTYGEYAHCLGKAGLAVEQIAGIGALREDHGALIVVNPNNPDGRILQPSELVELAATMRARGGHLHVDEAFGDGRPELSVAAIATEARGVTVSRSFGKFFGLAGVRLGFVFADPETLDFIEFELGPWAVSGPALHIARVLLRRDRSALVRVIGERRAGLQGALQAAGMKVAGGTDLFALVDHENAAGLFEHLAASHILVRKFDYAPHWLRIGLAADQRGDRRLTDVLASFESSCLRS